MQNFTHSDYFSLTAFEKELKQKLQIKRLSPKNETLHNIMKYSQALSVRKSKNLGHIEMILN